jgi:cell division protein FtsQ
VSTDDTPPEPVPGRPHPALDRRRRDVARDRGRRRRRVVLGAIGAVVCVLAGYWLATGPVLTINGVTVKGYRGPDAAQLQSELAAAASHGGSLLSPPVDNMTAIAQKFPGVQTISVARAWPLGLTVTVISADPFAVVTARGERSVVVSNRGLVMGPVPRHTIRASIVLSEPIPAFGKPLPVWAMQVIGFLEVIHPHTRPRIRGLAYAQGQLTGHFIKGPLLILGTLDRMADKAVAVNAVLAAVSAKTFATKTYLDVTVPDRPALGTGAPPSATASTSTSG